MNLSKMAIEWTLRVNQGDGLTEVDRQLDLYKSATYYTIDPNFYRVFFMDLPAGNLVGKQTAFTTPAQAAVTTGFKFVCLDAANAIWATSAVASLDWYEEELYYNIVAAMTATKTITANTGIASVKLVYIAGDGSATPVETDLFTSTAMRNPSLPEGFSGILVPYSAGPPIVPEVRGYPILLAEGDSVTVRSTFTIKLTK